MADDSASVDVLNATAQGQLRSFIERIERLEEDKAAVQADLKEVFAEAKGDGLRRQDPCARSCGCANRTRPSGRRRRR